MGSSTQIGEALHGTLNSIVKRGKGRVQTQIQNWRRGSIDGALCYLENRGKYQKTPL